MQHNGASTTLRKRCGDLNPHSALLLIDCQRGFLIGKWAQHFGLGQVGPIQQAFSNTFALLNDSQKLARCTIACTKCYVDVEDGEYDDALKPCLEGAPCIWKPTTDVTRNPQFHELVSSWHAQQVHVLVVGGCTTTSCVRVSSQAIKRLYPESLRVVVDLSLCGARVDNYQPTADRDPDLIRTYGEERCRGASAVELAVLQMRTNGVEVVDRFDWAAHNACGRGG